MQPNLKYKRNHEYRTGRTRARQIGLSFLQSHHCESSGLQFYDKNTHNSLSSFYIFMLALHLRALLYE
ncbi:unnamed protein product, partial [Brenthis ino]